MKILLLAPHPFYQERGTPIAVDLLVKALSDRGDEVDILTFHEGEDKPYSNASVHRINPLLPIKGISPGFSVKKLYCDLVLFFKMMSMLRKNQYDLIHAVEESATLAMFCKPFSKVPYIYDMDSVITEQLLEKSDKFKLAVPLVRFFESKTIKHSQAVVAVCQAIADYAEKYKKENIYLLKDISLISKENSGNEIDDLRSYVKGDCKIGLYIGNLESYQGIDLLIDGLVEYTKEKTNVCLLIIGGKQQDIDAYKSKASEYGVNEFIKFLGPRPIQDMNAYMQQADFLLSPRTKGINTPMKIYSYLASGIPVLATALPTHTQVMDDDISFLSDANAGQFSSVLQELISNSDLAQLKSEKAKEFIEQEHSLTAFNKRVNLIYDSVANQLSKG